MRRREFIAFLGGAAAWPRAARAQQTAMPVVGFLSSRAPGDSADLVMSFRRGLQEAGFVEGQNLVIAFRWAEGHYDRLPELGADLVGLKTAVRFAAGGGPAAPASMEGKILYFAPRGPEVQSDHLPNPAPDLVAPKTAVLSAAGGPPAALAA